MEDNKRFADLFNYFLYDGEQIIKPEDLEERSPEEILNLYDKSYKTYTKDKHRDLLKECIVREDDRYAYILLGLENQNYIDYAMPVRIMLYDAINYSNQVERQASINREEGKTTRKDFLSGYLKEDRLKPVITLVVYFGSEKWDGPRSIREMLDPIWKNYKEYISDYHINFIIPEEIEDFEKFKSDLRYNLEFLKHQKDKERILELRKEHEDYFSSMSVDSAKMLKACANIKVEIEREEEDINMCQALDEWGQDMRMEGYNEGVADERKRNEEKNKNLIEILLTKLSVEEIVNLGFKKETVELVMSCKN